MANPARLSTAHLLASTAISGPSRISSALLIAAVGIDDAHRVGTHLLIASTAIASPQRIGGHQTIVSAAVGSDIRIGGHLTYYVASVHQVIRFNLLEGGELLGVEEWLVESSFPEVPEFNPYRPTIPEEYHDLGGILYDYEKEHREITRQQHNLAQAGDTTFPWEMLAQIQDVQNFTLGSTGKFYHEDYGLIQARYVQFQGMTDVDFPACPVGLLNVNKTLEWVVTNDLLRSNANLVIGLKAAISLPKDGEYGWVIVNGGTIAASQIEDGPATRGTPLSWSATGKLSPTATGRIIARVIQDTVTEQLEIGKFKVELESLSKAEFQLLFGPLEDSIAALAVRVTALESDLGTVTGLSSQITLLNTRLNAEINARINADNGIRAMFTNYVTISTFNSAINTLNLALDEVDARLTLAVGTAQSRADAAYALAASIVVPDLTGLSTEVAELRGRVGDLEAAPTGWIPVVDGSVPPELVYFDDGSLVLLEVY